MNETVESDEPVFKYNNSTDYYGYAPWGDEGSPQRCFYIQGRAGELLIGDQLPSTEAEARLLCRCANRGYELGQSNLKSAVYKAFDVAQQTIKKI